MLSSHRQPATILLWAQFEFIINFKTAKAFGLSVPTSMQLLANEVRTNGVISAIDTKRTLACALHMSAYDPKRTSVSQPPDIFQVIGFRRYNAANSPCETVGESTWTKLSFH